MTSSTNLFPIGRHFFLLVQLLLYWYGKTRSGKLCLSAALAAACSLLTETRADIHDCYCIYTADGMPLYCTPFSHCNGMPRPR